ncbi:MAG: DUF4920 domain-containing protein [Candidatus Eisenbacteria bacterium]|nr:DUF4920 domain-containing protein [Candidatus Eisenbacteria bacterium]
MKLSRLVPAAVLASLLAALPAAAEEPPAPLAPLAVGAAVTVKKPVNIAKLAKKPERFAGKTVRLEGKVKAVCQGMGCWVEVEDAKGASFIARSLDESVLLPKDCAGRWIVVQGKVTTLPQAAKEEARPEDHACPRPEYVVSTEGAELK